MRKLHLILFGLLVGCGGNGLDRTIVVGSVTFNGKPIETGQIRFVPEGDTQGPLTITPIENGQYRCDHNGGVPVGIHRIEILAFDPIEPIPQGPGVPPRKQLLPAKYNRDSTLRLTVDSRSGELIHDFALER